MVDTVFSAEKETNILIGMSSCVCADMCMLMSVNGCLAPSTLYRRFRGQVSIQFERDSMEFGHSVLQSNNYKPTSTSRLCRRMTKGDAKCFNGKTKINWDGTTVLGIMLFK